MKAAILANLARMSEDQEENGIEKTHVYRHLGAWLKNGS